MDKCKHIYTHKMNSTDTSTHRPSTCSGADNKQPGAWLAAVLPFLKYLNTRALALLMFVGFALLNTTHGKDAQTEKPDVGVTNTEPRDNGLHGLSADAHVLRWQLEAGIDTDLVRV